MIIIILITRAKRCYSSFTIQIYAASLEIKPLLLCSIIDGESFILSNVIKCIIVLL